jgi:hypothetical protein
MPGEFISNRRDFLRAAGLSSFFAWIHPLSITGLTGQSLPILEDL